MSGKVIKKRAKHFNDFYSFANIMDGLDLLIHRHQTNEDVSNSTLYLFKFYMLCELALEYTSIECYKTTLQAALDGSLLLLLISLFY
jgi:hypothetical protein